MKEARLNINAAKIDKLTTESHSIKNVLNGQNSVKLGAEGVDSLKIVKYEENRYRCDEKS